MISAGVGFRSPHAQSLRAHSPCLDLRGRGIFGGNGTRVGL